MCDVLCATLKKEKEKSFPVEVITIAWFDVKYLGWKESMLSVM